MLAEGHNVFIRYRVVPGQEPSSAPAPLISGERPLLIQPSRRVQRRLNLAGSTS